MPGGVRPSIIVMSIRALMTVKNVIRAHSGRLLCHEQLETSLFIGSLIVCNLIHNHESSELHH
jgi:type IV secretory pathway ATPase VirB11/archaellum biosynthesis ATPase